ncbi:MAG: rRNA maturation RNase YbeY [Saprospiraceae bacterium]|nr:rRNA maturation RNase YbeY [Saprospiraceae bacterium]
MIEFPDWPGSPSEAGVFFDAEDVDFSLPDEAVSSAWLLEAIRDEERTAGVISIIFCSDEYLHQMNVQYLDHDTLTDVITFPYSDELISGDIFISIDRVAENAIGHSISFLHEMHRVMVHGVLHLIGYHDDDPEKKAAMREREDHYLSRLALKG